MREADINAHCTEIVNLMRAQRIPPVNGVKIGYVTGLQEALKFLQTPGMADLPGEEIIELMIEVLTITPIPT